MLKDMNKKRKACINNRNKIKGNNLFMISNSNLDCILNILKIFKLNKSIANTNNILHESITISAKIKVTSQYEEREQKIVHLAVPNKYTIRFNSPKVFKLLLNFFSSNIRGQVSHIDRFWFTCMQG